MPVFRDLFQQLIHFTNPLRCKLRLNDLLMSGKSGNDVAVHRVLEQRPVSARRDRAGAGGGCDLCPRHRGRPAPRRASLRSSPGRAPRCSRRERRADVSVGQLPHERLHEAHRFEDLVEAHRNARRDVAARVRSRARVELLVRRDRMIDAQIARDAARPGRKPGEAHPLGELGRHLPGHDEAVLRARVLVIDRFQGRKLALDSLEMRGQGFARGARQVPRDAAGTTASIR